MPGDGDVNLIEEALKRGARALSEHDSKLLLAEHGIPVTAEMLVRDERAAIQAAAEIGYPVVLKGSGEALAHKSELGMVAVDLRDETDVARAFRELSSHPDTAVEEVLVAQMVTGDRELVVGLSRDPQFGPCVMFGLGGVLTEITRDVTFRIAPLSRRDAMEMMDEIRGSRILEAFRGQPAVDREALADILIAVGDIGLSRDEISEIDINPIKISGGKPVAVDALVLLDHDSG
jgi:acetyl-CoA synthetase (ADP-forming)